MKWNYVGFWPLTPYILRQGAPVWAFGFLIIWATVVGAADQEPSYNDRMLSQWLADIQLGQVTGANAPEAAVRALGTNAIPMLLKWISYERTVAPANQIRTRVVLSGEDGAIRAEAAFRFLGPVARPAIPELTRLARTSSDQFRAKRCADSLAAIGPDSIPSLLSLATNGPPMTRWYAMAALCDFPGNPALLPAVPVLLKCMDERNEEIGSRAANTLHELGLPAVVVPALTNALRSPSPRIRMWAVRCLGWHHDAALSAIPDLRAAMRDPNYGVRVWATNVLRGWGGWEHRRQEWVRVGGTNSLHGITPDFFTNAPSH